MQSPFSSLGGWGEFSDRSPLSLLHRDIALPSWLFEVGNSRGHEKKIKWLRQQTTGEGLQPGMSKGSWYFLLSRSHIPNYL